ncbi:acetyltransferase [Domibacillus enclensis]|nr:acetyltransferase [Domibacillus enclensis]SIQ38501.1 UDP-perosamine 4-acetyltransferase [Domibacillus enclensis]
MSKPVILIGNGGHATVLTEILLQQKQNILGFTGTREEINRFGLSYLGTDEQIDLYSPNEIELILAIGSVCVSPKRAVIFNRMKRKGYSFATVIHPSAIISPHAEIGEGVHIMAGSIIQPFARIADNTIINTSASIDHDCQIKRHCHIAPGVVLSGNVQVEEGSHIGTGATVIQGLTIGKNVLVGAGALVRRQVADGKTVYGVPAKEVTQWNAGNKF